MTRWALVMAAIDAAHLADVDEAFVVDVIDGHGDFVGMAREHQPRRAALVENGDAVAVGVGKGFVGKGFDIIQPDPLAARFMAGGLGVLIKVRRNCRDSSRMAADYRQSRHKINPTNLDSCSALCYHL